MEVPKLSIFCFVFVFLLVWGSFNRTTSGFAMSALDCCGLKSKQLSRIMYRHQV